jgi:hypothetical protein
LRDKQQGPFLIVSRFQKHKIAVIPLSDWRITHFAFEEKHIKLAVCQSTHKLTGSHE